MKSKALAVVSVMCMIAVFGTVAKGEEYAVRVNVPFEFTVGTSTLPAGEYAITKMQTGGSAHVIKSHKVGAMAMTKETALFKGESSLVFHKYGDKYFLASIRASEMGIVYQLPKSELEIELIGQGGRPVLEMVAALTR
jgi:hypothetical protein